MKGTLICAITIRKRVECKVCIQTLTSSDSWKECPVTQAGVNKIGIQNITFLSKVQKALCCPREKFFGPAIHCKGREAANRGGIHPSPSSRANSYAPQDVGIFTLGSISKNACFRRLQNEGQVEIISTRKPTRCLSSFQTLLKFSLQTLPSYQCRKSRTCLLNLPLGKVYEQTWLPSM